MTEESDLLSTYLSSFIAICKGSVSPSSSTMTGAHILLESVKVIYFIEMLRHWRNKYSILILTPMWHKLGIFFLHRSMEFIQIYSSGTKQQRKKHWHLSLCTFLHF